jgi:signal transduction histidine kinase
VHWSAEEDDRSLWLYTACGLVRIARHELDGWVASVDGKQHLARQVKVTVYDESDGERSLSAPGNYHPQVAKTQDGRIWFLPWDGVSVVDPHHLPFNAIQPPVHVERIVADGKEYDGGARQDLPAHVRDLIIDYTALSLVVPEKVHFRVKLEGQDNDWRELVNVRHVEYTNLPPRSYRFRVIACNNSGVWNEAGASVAFSVAPAWFQTNPFRAACIAAVLTLLWGLYQLRLQQLRRQFNVQLEARVNERTRIARELHDTLLQSLHGLMFECQAVRNMFQKRPEEALQALDGAIVGTEQAIAESQDAIENLRGTVAEDDDLAQLIRSTGESFAARRGEIGDSSAFGLTVEGQQQALAPVVRVEIYRIARELLRNAFRHAHAHRIEAELLYGDDQLRLRVRDDGKGMNAQVLEEGGLPGHWGLPGVRERAQQIGAKLDIWSETGVGTEVQLAVAASLAYQKTTGTSRVGVFQRTKNT